LASEVPVFNNVDALVDSHCHLQDPKFDADRDAVIQRAREAGASTLVVIGYDIKASRRGVDLAESVGEIYATVGVHPHEAASLTIQDLDTLGALAESPKVVAIGEIGLDFYRNLSPPEAQRRAFQQQLNVARELSLPVVIHARQADEETFEILAGFAGSDRNEWPADRPIGVMHCFAGDVALAQRYIDLGFVISIPGTVTYPDAERLQAVCRALPLRSMVIETDAPYLSPVSHRGRRNEPAYLAETAGFIAALRGETYAEVASGTSETAARLFGLAVGQRALPAAGERA
jgi:TatD DNase family protein